MNTEQKKDIIDLIVGHLKYRNIEKNDFELTAAIPTEKLTVEQMQYIQSKDLSAISTRINNKDMTLIFGLTNMLVVDNNTIEGNKAQTKILEDYKNKSLAVKYNEFIMLGASFGTLGLAATTALMVASSPVTSIILGGATLGLAYYDNSRHFKKIIAEQLKSVLNKSFLMSLEKITTLREKYNENDSSTLIPKYKA